MRNPYRTQKIAFSLLFLATLLIVVPVGLIVIVIIFKGFPAINWQFLSDIPRQGMRSGGIFPAIIGTLYLVAGAIIFALPIGLLAAIYLSEYSKENVLNRIIRLAIINLSGVPSVVYGLFGLALFVVFFKFGASILAGSLTLGIMILPVIITTSREALESVPDSFREVSLSLGVSKWQTIRHIVLPNAIPGILTGTILGLGRAAGETAPILFTVAAFYLPRLPKSIFDQAMALPYHLYVISTQVPNVDEKIRYGTALVLLALVLFMNLVAIIIRYQFRRRKKW
ncbi:MAG: phosphate ABC transporter, permease protein PstA [Omnitrophica WOR_2 bacterium GWF2_38_59]|nr:MAG: phosphate ABC transporter, permease protein PstA [Omnitrophica WOR_2 bacterium GWF2_38_59]OGX48338.1 MAG: phosphate ABC transporter, permease protein PstA [Omnitrophica WOR_2 bacterium RIFOXYA2_FULL_38_17]OGX53152.1 MAG: phosphate ABC transporter, permease protein PstA [Omnitrophica WOR_2 bacterium RIFOXYA12_FULL_38_10]OGX55078.1 MAG: phosphate ABC transporter, permease protein PstA [Omnitrophica WOR_2 bacterium RIFOXYC2_FULL_38_12]OGX58066.1 MAG: phosphate ABC transporter, permease pro